jgi:anaerobic magnesium-protoporphyrin IX monomethyl ester cyclase
MRVVLITTPARTRKVNYVIPSGVIALAAHLESAGHTVIVVDQALHRHPTEELARRVADLAPDLVGLSGIITAYSHIIALIGDLRKVLPTVPVVLGGQVGINNVENCFTHMAIDYLVHGYGEFALEKLVRALQGAIAVEMIPGLSYRRGDTVVTNPGREFFRHLDDRPIPAYHLVDMEHYCGALASVKKGEFVYNGRRLPVNPRVLPVYGTLGCTDRCTFCVHEQEFVGIKLNSNRVLMAHLTFLHREYGINFFNMGEEMFISKLDRAREFNTMMKAELPECYWTATTRADFVTPDLITELKTGHCVGLTWGYESGSQRMLDLMNKRMSVAVNNRAVVLAREAGLYSSTTLMVGNVGETHQTIQETMAGVHEIGLASGSVFLAAAYPGGRTWDWAVERGIIADTHTYLQRISDRDAAQFNINLTPYPDFVLRAWQTLVAYAIETAGKAGRPTPQATTNRGLRTRLRRAGRTLWLGFLLPRLVAATAYGCDLLLRLDSRRRARFAIRVDAKGALLPIHLIRGLPQTFLSETQIHHLMNETGKRVLTLKPDAPG